MTINKVILAVLLSFAVVGVASAATFNYKLFKTFAERITVIEAENGVDYEVYKFTDNGVSCYYTVTMQSKSQYGSLSCVK